MIVVDSSAIIAMLFNEASAGALTQRLTRETKRVMSAASYIEVGAVLAGRRRSDRVQAQDDLDLFLAEAGIELAPVDEAQARLALRARIAHGRGTGPGGLLNFGDVFSYALAKALDAPLLCAGDDFAATDIVSGLYSDPSKS